MNKTQIAVQWIAELTGVCLLSMELLTIEQISRRLAALWLIQMSQCLHTSWHNLRKGGTDPFHDPAVPQPRWNEVATARIWRRRRKRLTRWRRGAAEAPAAGTAKGAKRSVGGWIYRRGNDFGASRRAGGILRGGFGLIARRARSRAVASGRRGVAREIDFLPNTKTVGRLFCCVFVYFREGK
jgi:hypothetical protein